MTHGICRLFEDVQHGDGQDVGAKEPVVHVDVANAALGDGHEEDDGVGHPDRRDHRSIGQSARVFMGFASAPAAVITASDNHRLPPPNERGQASENKRTWRCAAPLIRGGNQAAAAKGEDHRIGMQRPQAPIAEQAISNSAPARQLRGNDPDQLPTTPQKSSPW